MARSYSVHLNAHGDLIEALKRGAEEIDVPMAVYTRAILAGAFKAGSATRLALMVLGDEKRKPLSPGTLVPWVRPDPEIGAHNGDPGVKASARAKTYTYGPWTLLPVSVSNGGQDKTPTVWWLNGPGTDIELRMKGMEARREASIIIRRWEAEHPEGADAPADDAEDASGQSGGLSGSADGTVTQWQGS